MTGRLILTVLHQIEDLSYGLPTQPLAAWTTALGATNGRWPGNMMLMRLTTSQTDMRRKNAMEITHQNIISSGKRALAQGRYTGLLECLPDPRRIE